MIRKTEETKMLLPPSMQDKTEFMPLGKAIQKPEPVKADPVREFEKHNHDIPGAPKLPRVTPEMASRALRSLYPSELKKPRRKSEMAEEYEREQAKIAAQASGTSVIGHWTNAVAAACGVTKDREYSEPWDGLFQKQAAKQMERLDKLSELSKPPALTWPTLPDLPEPTFLPEVVNPAPSKADIAQFEVEQAEKRARAGLMVLQVERELGKIHYSSIYVNDDDMEEMLEWFGPLGVPERWGTRVLHYPWVDRMKV